jgi:hypothetical protein
MSHDNEAPVLRGGQEITKEMIGEDWIEMGVRLIAQQDGYIRQQRAGKGQPLPLADAQTDGYADMHAVLCLREAAHPKIHRPMKGRLEENASSGSIASGPPAGELRGPPGRLLVDVDPTPSLPRAGSVKGVADVAQNEIVPARASPAKPGIGIADGNVHAAAALPVEKC